VALLNLSLLGGFQLLDADGRAVAFPTKKTRGLMAYLALPLGQSHPRDKLAALLWGDMQAPQARAGLRQAVYAIRKAAGEDCMRIDGETLALNPAALTVDAQLFERAVGEGTPELLERAATLYQGDLLAGLSLQEPPFEEWLLAERERLRELALEALARLLAHQRRAGSREAAVQTALKLLALDPLQEPVHRTLMRIYLELGRRGAALRQYQLCVGTLQRELRAQPEPETRALYQEILRRRSAAPTIAEEPVPGSAAAAGPQAPALQTPAADTALVGRDSELLLLRNTLGRAWAGRGQFLAVIGEAGIGKSRLTAEVAAEAIQQGGRVLLGRCYESEQILPFGPWIDAFRTGQVDRDPEALRALDRVSRSQLGRLLPELGPGSQPGPGPEESVHLFGAVARLLECLASSYPVLLILEDLHWADELSLRVAAFLARRLFAWRLLVIATLREENLSESPPLRRTFDELGRDRHLISLRLEPLSKGDTMTLTKLLASPGSNELALATLQEQVWRTSDGNPFLVVESMRALREGPVPESATALPLPERVRDLVSHQMERLGERGRRLLTVAAVIGRRFEFTLLQRAASLAEADAAEGLEELVRHRVLHGVGEEFDFTHEWIRQVVYEQLLAPRRVLLHRWVAEALEALHAPDPAPHALALGTHYRAGEVWDKAVGFLREAGAAAAARTAPRDAVTCYEQAVAALRHLPESRDTQQQLCDLCFRLGHSLYMTGQFEAAIASYRQAEDIAASLGDYPRLGEISAGMAYLLGSEGKHREAVAAGERALTIAVAHRNLALQVWTSIGLGRSHFALGRYRQAIQRTRWVVSALRDVSFEERFGRGSLLPSVGSRTWLALCLSRMGDFPEAIAWGEEAIRIAETVETLPDRVWAYYSLGRVHLSRGDVHLAQPVLERALPLCSGGAAPIYFPRVLSSLGEAYALAGKMAEGLRFLEQAVAEAEAIHLLYGHSMVVIQLGDVLADVGRLDEARRFAARGLEICREQGARGDEAWALHLEGDIAARRDPIHIDTAVEAFGRARVLAEELEMRPLQARCHLGLGAAYQRARRPDRAGPEISAAIDLFRSMEMRFWLRRAETLLRPGTG
jgi:DNA-binding SARP family transcriptional activator